MKVENIAKAYAKSLKELGREANADVASELTSLTEVINENNDLETALFLDLFTVEEKENVLIDVVEKMKLSDLVKSFLCFLNQEKRIGILPLIFKELVVLDDHEKGFLKGQIEGANESVDPDFEKNVKAYLEKEMNKKIELSYVQSDKVSAGYRVTVEDLQLDASLDNQLKNFKETVLN